MIYLTNWTTLFINRFYDIKIFNKKSKELVNVFIFINKHLLILSIVISNIKYYFNKFDLLILIFFIAYFLIYIINLSFETIYFNYFF